MIAIAVLLLVNGFFVAAEFALVRSRRTRLESMARTGDWKARVALRASGNLARVYSASQLGVTLASLGLGALAESTLGGWMAGRLATLPWAIELSVRVGLGATIALAIITVFHVVFGELAPRGAALSHPEEVASWLTPPLLAFAWVASPFDDAAQPVVAARAARCSARSRPTRRRTSTRPEELRHARRAEPGGRRARRRRTPTCSKVYSSSLKRTRAR